MFLYGAGGHAKVIIDILNTARIPVAGIFDDNLKDCTLSGYPILGKYNDQELSRPLIISIGNNLIRASLAKKLSEDFGIAVHSGAIVSPSAVIEAGTVVMQGAVIQADAKVGKHVIINTNASVDHDCIIRSFSHISPGVVLCGHVEVGEGTFIGAGSVVTPGVKIGEWCKVAAGSVITKDLPSNVTVKSVNTLDTIFNDRTDLN